jgi:hypothetical protein
MANKTPRVDIPKNVEEVLTLGEKIYEKHVADGAKSPLNTLQDYDWNTVGPNLAPALAKHNEAEEYERKMKEAYEARNKLMGDIAGIIKASRDLLKGVNSKSPQKLGEWGYDVFDTPLPKKPKAE